MKRHHIHLISLLLASMLGGAIVQGQTITVTDATGWNSWLTGTGAVMVDPSSDQQTGQGQDDFVGTSTQPGFQQKSGYLASDPTNQYIEWRARMGKYDTKGFGGSLELGLDLTGTGTINLIMKLTDKSGSRALTFAAPGPGLNNSPATTSWGSFTGSLSLTTATYNYQAAPDAAIAPYTQDAYVTFALSYANLQNAIRLYAVDPTSATPSTPAFTSFVVNDSTRMGFVAFTSTQGSAINQDLFGTSGNLNSTTSFTALGAGTAYAFTNGAVPEPATYAQVGVLLLVGGVITYRRRRRSAET